MSKTLWAPWRMEFVTRAHQKQRGCLFCRLPQEGTNKENLVLSQGKRAFIILNRYPYSIGHIMVVPNRHLADFSRLNPDEHIEIGELLSRSLKVLKKVFKAQGFNVGLNLGSIAGAGIKNHLHYHVVPRWEGDSNFMPVIGDTRVLPEHICESYRKMAPHFKK